MYDGAVAIDVQSGHSHPDAAAIQTAIDRFRFGAEAARVDAHEYRERVNTRRFDSVIAEMRADSGRRADAFSPAAGNYMARDLEYVYSEVLQEELPPMNSFTLFPQDQEVPPGANEHNVRREYGSGEAGVYRRGMARIPRVDTSMRERRFPVRHLVTSFGLNLFERQAAGFAGVSKAAGLLRTARQITMELLNEYNWYGNADHGLFGVLNFPWILRRIAATAFTDDSAPDDILAEMNDASNFPNEFTRQAMSPDSCVTSPRVRNYLFNRLRNATTASDTTIGEQFLRNQSRISTVEEAWELQGVGPGGTDGVLFYRRDRMGVTMSVPQPFTTLPTQTRGFDDETLCYLSTGGCIARAAGSNIILWVTPQA